MFDEKPVILAFFQHTRKLKSSLSVVFELERFITTFIIIGIKNIIIAARTLFNIFLGTFFSSGLFTNCINLIVRLRINNIGTIIHIKLIIPLAIAIKLDIILD